VLVSYSQTTFPFLFVVAEKNGKKQSGYARLLECPLREVTLCQIIDSILIISSFYFSYGFSEVDHNYNTVAGVSGDRIIVYIFKK